MPIYHKGNYKRKFHVYIGLGNYDEIPSPLCNTKATPYSKPLKNFLMVRNWKQVTCKHCLRIKELG